MTGVYIAGGAVVIVLAIVWLGFRYAKKSGAAEAQRDDYAARTEQARVANEIDEDVAALDDDALDRELRGR